MTPYRSAAGSSNGKQAYHEEGPRLAAVSFQALGSWLRRTSIRHEAGHGNAEPHDYGYARGQPGGHLSQSRRVV
jgi:hypothetical protein